MPLPPALHGLALPAIAAPMFLVSGPDLVVEACRSGLVGAFPALNRRSSAEFAEWVAEIAERLDRGSAPFAVNLIVHRTNPRLQPDLQIVAERRVPLVITSLGAVREVVQAVHAYGGLVLHDVINLRHAARAAEAGVDGLIAVAAGAGGHAGTLSPFAFLHELRAMFDGTLVLSGAISTGAQIAAAQLMGADLAYLGTRFIATQESLAPPDYKQMLLACSAKDIVYTPAISGVHANFLRPSLERAGVDLDSRPEMDMGEREKRAWKDIWSAGQGVGAIDDIPATAELCRRLMEEYRRARQVPGPA
ncbi:MAG: nitronate monooxygenase [Acidisphaera sp.]|nr:nitronate monooxygenase [Acidisphaera sp.]